ncbi:DUF6809 family protein [Paenibacillus phocaensis]|uniref:DUF6809 family protein n=1 Tax=Paenibacillus phocaensis TaxID=1776378 RepID=UPI002FCD5B9C
MLEAFYCGEIRPEENRVPTNPEYRKISRRVSEAMGMWEGKLSAEDFNQLEAMLDLRSQSESMHATDSFVHGFQLGAIMFMEVYAAKEELLCGSR